ncbi:hypothetical protein VR45_18615, partial [Streptomyces sp. NRRL S-495]
ADQVASALAARPDVPPEEAAAVVENYQDAQIDGLKAAVLACSCITAGAVLFTGHLPGTRPGTRTGTRPGNANGRRSVPPDG